LWKLVRPRSILGPVERKLATVLFAESKPPAGACGGFVVDRIDDVHEVATSSG
jgi:hypothetical protein